MDSTGSVRILVIDGGGVKGIIPLKALLSLEQSLQQKLPNSKLQDHFDLIVGTSTGAIIALLLLKGHTVEEIIEFYQHFANVVFPPSTLSKYLPKFMSNWIEAIDLMRGAKHSTKPLEDLLKNEFKESKMSDYFDSKLKVVITTTLFRPYSRVPEARCFYNSSYQDPSVSYYRPNGEIKLWEAARCSSAAPYYFDQPYLIEKPAIHSVNSTHATNSTHAHKSRPETYIDGGILHNNPIFKAIEYAQKIFPDRSIEIIVSLGCGKIKPLKSNEPSNDFKVEDLPEFVKMMMDLSMETQMNHESFKVSIQVLAPELSIKYFRLNPSIPQVNMDDPTVMPELEKIADEYLKDDQKGGQMISSIGDFLIIDKS